MLGLLGTLDLARRSLQAQQQCLEVTSNNIANASNPAYARQQAIVQTSPTLPTAIGPEGTGVDVVAIQQVRSSLLDGQVANEASVTGYLQSRQTALQSVETPLGEQVDGTAGTASDSDPNGIAAGLSNLFNAFQSLSTDPSSLAQRQAVLGQAQTLATTFNQAAQQLDAVHNGLNQSLTSAVASANTLLTDIASLNGQINQSEASGSQPNDLIDQRQQDLESLSNLTSISTTPQSDGTVNLSIGGTQLISGGNLLDTLTTYDAGGGQLLVGTQTSGTPLTLTGGTMQGTIDTRDGELASVSHNLDTLAGQLITQVNNIHSTGYGLNGSSGNKFFTGSDASTIAVNADLVADPTLVQASGTLGTSGDNTVALQLAQLGNQTQAALGNATFSDSYSQTVTGLGQSLNSVNSQLTDQQAISNMLTTQRDSVSGVSLDEETTNLAKFQQAYEASARVVTVVDQLLSDVINMVPAS